MAIGTGVATHYCMLCMSHATKALEVDLPHQQLSRAYLNSCMSLSAYGQRAHHY